MDPHPLTFFTFPWNFLSIVIFITSAHQAVSVASKFQACEPKTCGGNLTIKYPFWISGEQESFCGYPNFEITCNDQKPVFNISSENFFVKDIFYENSSLRLANSIAYEASCPTPLYNLSLNQTPFNFVSSDEHLFFWYNCSENPPADIAYPVICASDDDSHNYSFAGFHKELFQNYSCKSFVYAPLNVETGANLWYMNYADILKMGFLLNWTAHSCSNCEASGGRCGFNNDIFVCFCQDRTHHKTCHDGNSLNLGRKLGIGIVSSIIGIIIMSIIICICKRKKMSSIVSNFLSRNMTKNVDFEAFIRDYGSVAPKRHSYSEVKRMTNSFKDKLGQGGYGGVYKGKSLDGNIVAVKLLNASKGNGQEFINEVASISRTSHVNVVRLLGFCLEGNKRAIIYEFMVNGSLEKFIYNEKNLQASQCLEWEKMYEITIGVAQGLEYLHRGCSTRILHFDIKPHNILLDENLCPKISDFGLAKLCLNKESIVSMLEARGTIGYIAPEVFSRSFGEVSHKSDVYSYGMMILEIVGGRKSQDVEGILHSSEMYFPHWIYKRVEQGKELKWHGVKNSEENEIVKKMIVVGLWCIQTRPSDRPSMNKVLEMLQASSEVLPIPREPFLSSSSSRLPIYSSTVSMS
ncbi:LEAF RUST 10 DISEASE-RESISTANCE LOCUS RECEPTOR-LIKE PROTEIN KINASE-like 2.1 isoform X2 [Mangifera indica]|uniref:LEAF RUST 10 DISEASE-RESISTANCE LOCUS RECEPTOR-LIKE PROTEIN KINASE-like 2.1 isoform X2 n=1 Tax=Mangifera indica TaxID=29780 RepID=UPI001CFBE1AC|nr:LEAF RUST 10 DISEASE-RESISTANCE LOCUS RECEPTOR-LIKE PROTEIN KINASE-like 2.1 isoform X2 [Mangifera indica]